MDVIRLDASARARSGRTGKIAGFDTLRAFAALAVVMLHAGVPYLHQGMPGLIWPAEDAASRWVDAVFWGIEVMVMPLFLVIAGFLMWQSAQKATPGQLIRSRARRLLIPFAFGMVVVLPIDLYVWTLGLVAEGVVPPVKLKSLKFEAGISEQIWGTSHLWFLLYVFLYVVVAAMLLRFAVNERWSERCPERLRRLGAPRPIAVTLVGLATLVLVIRPEVVWGFQHAFMPVPSKWLYSGAFFAAGCVLAKHDPRLRWSAASVRTTLALAAILLIAALMMGTWYLAQDPAGHRIDRAAMACLSLVTVGAAAATTLGLIGVCQRLVRSTPKSVAYLAAASFWIYLVHHPLLGLIHIDLKWLWPQGNPAVKMVVAFSLATLLSLVSYEVFVRQTRLGRWLGMSWPNAKPQRDDATRGVPVPAVQRPDRRAA